MQLINLSKEGIFMSVQAITNNVATATVNTVAPTTEKKNTETKTTATESKTGFDETAVVYEKNKTDTVTTKNNAVDRDAIIAQMKADTQARMNQLTDIVKDMMKGQGNSFAIASNDDVWSFLASGNYTVTEAAKLQAQEDISENGYWGVKQTSDRILDFAKALSGGDASKADLLLDAFKKGYQKATGSWGKNLPDICQETYKAVEEKFAAWKKESETTTQTTPTTDPTTQQEA